MIKRLCIVLILFSFLLIIQSEKYLDPEDSDYRDWQEFKEFQEWKRSKSSPSRKKELIENEDNYKGKSSQEFGYYNEDNTSVERNYERSKKKHKKSKNNEMKKGYGKNKEFNENDPPPINEAVLMARYIVNQANWTSVATISSRKDIKAFPSANVISLSDGELGNGTGIPYMYLTPLDFTVQDIFRDSRASLMMSLAQGHYCNYKNYDPMDPRCARVILTGKIRAIKNDSLELETAKNAVFGRHPWLENMPSDHHFFFAKLKIVSIAMLDTFGGPKFITVKDYLRPPCSNGTDPKELLDVKYDNFKKLQNVQVSIL